MSINLNFNINKIEKGSMTSMTNLISTTHTHTRYICK